MQKKLIALAIAGLSGAAFAQSNVTLYGVMEATTDVVSATGATASGLNYASRNRNTFNSSYFGLKGTEDLGGGLKVNWQIENGITENGGATSTVGANGGAIGNRDTYLQILGGWGDVVWGTLTAPARGIGAAMDVNAGATGIGGNSALIGKLGGGSGAGYFDQRFANAVAYHTPLMSGFKGAIGYVPNENRTMDGATNTGVAATSAKNTSGWTVGLFYNNGPIYAAYGWTRLNDAAANNSVANSGFGPLNTGVGGATISSATNNRLAFKYNFGSVTLGAMWDQTKATVPTVGNVQQTVWYIPLTWQVTANGKIITQYGKAGNLSGVGAGDYQASHLELGYEHSLSKRTNLKVVWSGINNHAQAGYDYLYGVSAPNTTASGAAISAGADPRGISLGLRHTF
jgi:predicted porin